MVRKRAYGINAIVTVLLTYFIIGFILGTAPLLDREAVVSPKRFPFSPSLPIIWALESLSVGIQELAGEPRETVS